MKKSIFLIFYFGIHLSYASENIKEYSQETISGCNGIAVFNPKDEIKAVIKKPQEGLNIEISSDKKYIMVHATKDSDFLVTTVNGYNYKVFFSSKSCKMPSKTYEGCFSKKQEIKFKHKLETVFSSLSSKDFYVSENSLFVSNVKEKFKVLYIQEQNQEMKPILLKNVCS